MYFFVTILIADIFIRSIFMISTTKIIQNTQLCNDLKFKQKENLNTKKQTKEYEKTTHYEKISSQHFQSQISFGMINPILKKSMSSPIFLQMKTMKNFWHQLNCLSPKINIGPIQQMFEENIKEYLKQEKYTVGLFNENGKTIQLAETEERYENFYHNQHLKWKNFFVENKSCEVSTMTPDEIFVSSLQECRNKIPEELEKNNQKLEMLKQSNASSQDIKKQIEKTTKLLKLQQNYIRNSNEKNFLIDKESLKFVTAQGIISGLQNKNFIVFKHNIPIFQSALKRYIDYQVINPPNLVEHLHPSNKKVSSLSKLLGVIPNKPTFSQCMKHAFLEDVFDPTLNFHPISLNDNKEIGVFTKIPQTNHDDPNFNKRLALMRYLSHSNWCTKFKSAASYLQDADFYCFTPYEGGRKICLVIKNNEEIHSLESAENSHSLSEEDFGTFATILKEFPTIKNIIQYSPYKDILEKIEK